MQLPLALLGPLLPVPVKVSRKRFGAVALILRVAVAFPLVAVTVWHKSVKIDPDAGNE
jgi:hypothetical protein